MFAPINRGRTNSTIKIRSSSISSFSFSWDFESIGLRTSRKFAGSNKERCLANRRCFRCARRFCYSNPRSPRGERQKTTPLQTLRETFQSTLPVRGATRGRFAALGCPTRISIHAPREGSELGYHWVSYKKVWISIHAPREGSDLRRLCTAHSPHISIHAPREGSDRSRHLPSCRTAHFNPRSPRGERLREKAVKADFKPISIHAPREGSDYMAFSIFRNRCDFNPRSPRGERPVAPGGDVSRYDISIHAPREGSDPF